MGHTQRWCPKCRVTIVWPAFQPAPSLEAQARARCGQCGGPTVPRPRTTLKAVSDDGPPNPKPERP